MSKYTFRITAGNFAEIEVDGALVDWPGPFTDHDSALSWAIQMVDALYAGEFSYTQEAP